MSRGDRPPDRTRGAGAGSAGGRRVGPSRLPVYLALGALAVFSVGPLLVTWITAFKTSRQIVRDPFGLPDPFTLDNLSRAWTVGHFSIYFWNSVFISIAAVLGMVTVSSLAGYALGRMRFRGERLLLLLFLVGLTIPITAIIIPLYLTMRDFHLLDTQWSVIVAHIAIGVPIFTFIMRGFFKGLPRELDDAARVDGCGELRVFWSVMLPLARPGVLTVALLEFLWSWNSLLLPLVFLTRDQLRTLPVGLLFLQGRTSVEWGSMSAGVMIIALPIVLLFVLFQRNFTQGLTGGSVKG